MTSIYLLYDTVEAEYATAPSGKSLWATKGAAKNAAYTFSEYPRMESGISWRGRCKTPFKDQLRYECREFNLDDVEYTVV